MIDTYLNDQNISNNIIIKKPNESNKQKRIFISSEKSMSYSSSVDDKNETIDNQINDSTSSFDYSDTLRVSEIPKKETTENFFEKSKNFLDFLSKAVSENFDFFNLPRKTNINNIIIDKNRKKSNVSFKRATSGDKIQEKTKKNRLASSSVTKNNIINRIKSSKFLKKNEDNSQNKRMAKVTKLINKQNGNNKANKNKKITGEVTNRNKNIICRNININLSSENSKILTNINNSKNINLKENLKLNNDLNNIDKSKLNRIKIHQEEQRLKNSKENNQRKINNYPQNQKNSHLNRIETPNNIKNIDMAPRLTVPLYYCHENISTQNIFENKNKQINLDIKYNHTLSKSPKSLINKNLFPPENTFKKRITNINLMNRQSVSPNPNQFGRQSIDSKRNDINNINNQPINDINNIYNVKKDLDFVLNHINKISNQANINDKTKNNLNRQRIQNENILERQNNSSIFENINNQIPQNQLLIDNFHKLPESSVPVSSQQRLTISTPTTQNDNLEFSHVLMNIPNQVQRLTEIPNNKNKINLNISLNPIINNYQNYIISEDPISNTKKDFNITYNSFDPTGILKNYGILTLPGKDTSGLQKTNQDSFTFITNINNLKDFNIFGVLDGHGIEGHFVSKFASKYIPNLIINNPEIKNIRETELIYKILKKNNYQIITKAYFDCDIALQKVNFDSKESGCTCNLIINIGNHIICANTGDSRAIVVFDESKDWVNNYKCIPLSIDFKPEMPEEMNRIILNGGEVRQIKNELGEAVGPFRVWKRGEGYPGLAMSRSIGDLNGKKIGIIPNPGIIEYLIEEKSKYIVVCSDGVWEFLNNENVKEIGEKYYVENNPSGFCHDLVNTSFSLWEKNDIVIDDITAVVAFF